VAVKKLDLDEFADVVGAGDGAGSRVTGYRGTDLIASPASPSATIAFDAFSNVFNGVFVG
jgi:hypothetical protein